MGRLLNTRLALLFLVMVSLPSIAKPTLPIPKLSLLQCFNIQKNLHTGNIPRSTPKVKEAINIRHKEVTGLDYAGIVPWDPQKRKAVQRFLIEKVNADFLAQQLPAFNKAQKLGPSRVAVSDIRWSQVSCRNMSQDKKYSVVSNAHAIKEGKLDIKILPTIRVWRDTQGRIWTLDHRRLAAIKLSGVIDEIPVEFVSEEIVKAQKFKFGTQNEGKSMFVYLDEPGAKEDLAIVLMDEK
jgi:hypothetical protein